MIYSSVLVFIIAITCYCYTIPHIVHFIFHKYDVYLRSQLVGPVMRVFAFIRFYARSEDKGQTVQVMVRGGITNKAEPFSQTNHL